MIIFLTIILIIYINNLHKKIDAMESNIKHPTRTGERLYLHPTAEKISYTVQFNIGQFLLYLFPNTFYSQKEAEEYYISFIKKAKDFKEDEQFYSQKIWHDGTIYIDLLSNMRLYWNRTLKTLDYGINFKLFTPYNIKNENLRNEIKLLYDENFEHLKKINFLPQNGNITDKITFFSCQAIWITPKQIRYCKYNKYGLLDKQSLYFPLCTFLKLLRINSSYDLTREERKEIVKKFKKLNKKRPYKFKLNFKENYLQIQNKFLCVDVWTEYYYPEKADDIFYGYKVKDVDLF